LVAAFRNGLGEVGEALFLLGIHIPSKVP